jgi:putative hydrolase of the HAD superfamily
MMIKTVIFDLGKVLLDYSFDNTYKYWSEKSGTPVEILKTNFSTDEQYKQHEIGNISIEQYHQHLCDTLKMNISLEEFIIGWNAMFIGLYPKTISILNQIGNKSQKVLLSNTNKTHTIFLRKYYKELLDHLNIVFFSNEIQKRKPNGEAFLYVLNTCGVRPNEALFFDDLEENIIGAKEIGINSVLVNDPNIIENDLRKYHIL